MTREVIRRPVVVGISISESPDMSVLGLGDGHLRSAMAAIAAHVLARGDDLAYGGDLRGGGFTELLLELVVRYSPRDLLSDRTRVTDYLAWPVHISMSADALDQRVSRLHNIARLALIDPHGSRISMEERRLMPPHEPDSSEWEAGLTAMRGTMLAETDVRVVVGGRVHGYKGRMPGIAEEALLSLEAGQALFLLGGYGGCARDIAETLGLIDGWSGSRPDWPGREHFRRHLRGGLNNGLSPEENGLLAHTPYIDQAISMIVRGLNRLCDGESGVAETGNGKHA